MIQFDRGISWSRKDEGGAVAVLRIPNIEEGHINLNDLKYIDPKNENGELDKNDIVMVASNGNPDLVGRSALVTEKEKGMRFASFLVRLRLDDTKLLSHYAHLFLLTPIFKRELRRKIATTSGIYNLRKEHVEKIKIPLPPLKIQKQIVERLDKIAEAQKLNDELIQKTDELFQSLLYKELNPAGKNWEVKKLKEVCEINPSKAGINKLSENTGVSFLAMANVSESAEIINRQDKKINEVKNGFTFFEDGDVLVAKITPCFENGKGALVENMKNGIGFGSTEFHVLRSNYKILLNRFLYYLVSDKKFRKIGAKFMTGSAGQRRVTRQYLENHKISLPPLKTQKQIVTKLSAVQDYKKQLLGQKSKLKELFDSALAESMTSEKSRKMSEILIK